MQESKPFLTLTKNKLLFDQKTMYKVYQTEKLKHAEAR